MSPKPADLLGGLPIPDKEAPLAVSTRHVLAVGAVGDLARVAGVDVPSEHLLPHPAESVPGPVDMDLILHGLGGKVLSPGVQCCRWHRMHGWIGDILHGYGDAPLPDQDLLVIGSGDKTLAVVADEHRVHRLDVVIVLLHRLSSLDVPLPDSVVARRHEELILLYRMELDLIRHFSVAERRDALASLRVPVPHVPIERSRDEVTAIVGKVHISHALRMASVGPPH
mmetsp:Transcript_24192/g.71041  ORF Transcript_24192/g.71041 Transcript_24192/m.71041 type:complete len:225 (-) Transcript_24192:1073-1747(-)